MARLAKTDELISRWNRLRSLSNFNGHLQRFNISSIPSLRLSRNELNDSRMESRTILFPTVIDIYYHRYSCYFTCYSRLMVILFSLLPFNNWHVK